MLSFLFCVVVLPAQATQKPVADLSVSKTSGNAPLTVKFTDKSTGGKALWKWWGFGDGTGSNSTDKTVTYTYTKPGKYTVFLKATNEAGTSTKTYPVPITVTTSTQVTKIVVVDPGHGGSDPGAVGNLNGKEIYEKDINLGIALALKDALEYHGYKVIMTRSTDKKISLSKRAKIANDNKADAFVSVHCNGNDDSKYKGATVIYPLKHDVYKSELMASWVLDKVVSQTSLKKSRDVYQENLQVLRETKMPAILTETGFLSNPSDLKYISKSSNQESIGWRIGTGVYYYLYYYG